MALDQKIAQNLTAGIEFSQRELKVPTFNRGNADEREKLGRGYVYWAPLEPLAVSLEYQYEKIERDPQNQTSEELVDSETHKVPLEARFFHPSGFFAKARTTYINQDGRFKNSTDTVVNGSDNFWVFDTSLGYRLPKRLGLVSLTVFNFFVIHIVNDYRA